MKRNTWLMLLTFIIFLSCGRQKGDNELLPIVKEWYGKEVKFPDHPVFTLYGKDTVDYSIPPIRCWCMWIPPVVWTVNCNCRNGRN